MHTNQLPLTGSLPAQWIGVKAGWQALGENPLDNLVTVSQRDLETHALALGSTGSGKTNLLHHLIAQAIARKQSVVVIDARGDLVDAAIEAAGGRVEPSNVALLDLREKKFVAGFNPLAGAGEPYFRALNVLSVIQSSSESWGVQLEETLRNALLLLAETGGNLCEIGRLLTDDEFLSSRIEKSADRELRSFWKRFRDVPSEKRLPLVSPVLNKIAPLLATKYLRRMFSHEHPLDLGKHLDKKGSLLLLSLAVDELHGTGGMVGKLGLSAICREIFARVQTPQNYRNPVAVFVDEFEHFAAGEEFESLLAEGRRFKCSLILAHQTLAQLSPRMRSMVLNNVGVKFAFRCGREDAAAMSKDITGDAKVLKIADLGVGRTYFWKKQSEPIEVEVNEPFLRAGRMSTAGQNLLRSVKGRNGAFTAEPEFQVCEEPKRDKPRVEITHRKPSANRSAMEDWL